MFFNVMYVTAKRGTLIRAVAIPFRFDDSIYIKGILEAYCVSLGINT